MTAELPTPRWLWEETDPNHAGAAGDLAKLFRNDPVKEPGLFAEGAPPRAATVLAREVIQNAWDSALERRESSRTSGPPEFEIRFRYRSAVRDEKQRLFRLLSLAELKRRADNVGDRSALGLSGPHHCFDDTNSATPLTQLLVEETGTTGMYGPWRGAQSKLYLALLSVGFTPKNQGQGGSYGYGKAGLIAGSKIRTVIAYTCFGERLDDPGVTRRLLGMTYWGQHSLGASDFTGFARFGAAHGSSARPFENEQADEVAELFGFDRRDPADPNAWGTSLLLVEPAVNQYDLEKAICRSWWPALDQDNHDVNFHVEIEGADGRVRIPRPKSDPALASFHEAYEIASQIQAAPEARRKRYTLHGSPGKPGPDSIPDGILGLAADPDGWTFARNTRGEEGVNHRSLVALMRKPRMVVEYLEVGQSAPFVRGVFVADDSTNDTLRQTEPKGHDAWQTEPDGEGPVHAFALAASITRRVKQKVNAFRKELKPPPKPAETYQLKLFQREMRKLLGGSTPSGPPPTKRPVSIRFTDGPRLEETKRLDRHLVTGKAEVGLSEHAKEDSALIEVEIRFPLLEDGQAGKDSVDVAVEPPVGFVAAGNGASRKYVGVLHRGEPMPFRFRTEPILSDWSGRLEVRADPIPEERRPHSGSTDSSETRDES